MTELGRRIRRAREANRLTQRQLADLLGVDRKTIDNWENGRTNPRNRTAVLEEVLKVPLSAADTSDPPELRDTIEQQLWELDLPRDTRLGLIAWLRARRELPPDVDADQSVAS